MYLYYFLMTVKCKPKWFQPQWITIAQISQMVLGSIISIAAFHAASHPGCWATWQNNTGILIMYISYLVLFVHFFLQRYVIGVKVGKKNVTAAGAAANESNGNHHNNGQQQQYPIETDESKKAQ